MDKLFSQTHIRFVRPLQESPQSRSVAIYIDPNDEPVCIIPILQHISDDQACAFAINMYSQYTPRLNLRFVSTSGNNISH